MLFLYTGTDRVKARKEMDSQVKKVAGSTARVVHISDVNSEADVEAAFSGGGMFAERRVVVLDGILLNDVLRERVIAALTVLRSSTEPFFILEEKPDADTRKRLEKYAEQSERFDAPAKKRDNSIFELANALRAGGKRQLWLGLQREYAKGSAPEAVHGILFWAVKDMLLKARSERERERAKKLIAELAQLPHEARRRGEDLEYALERFTLSDA